jgi:hypothetical protein
MTSPFCLFIRLRVSLCIPVCVYPSVCVSPLLFLDYEAFEITVLSVCISPLIFDRRLISSPCYLYVLPNFFCFLCGACRIKRK